MLMIRFQTKLKKFEKQGEKSGWTYVEISKEHADSLNPGVRVSYRVKGSIDAVALLGQSILPMGHGGFILPVNATLRKSLRKKPGDIVTLELELDPVPYAVDGELLDALSTEAAAWQHFHSLPGSHRNYFSKWIQSAKTNETRQNRIARTVNAMLQKKGFAEMMREGREDLKTD